MRRLLVLACALALAVVSVHKAGAVGSTQFTGGDSALAAGGSFKIYPLAGPGGAHMHAMQWVTPENGQFQASAGFLFTSLSALRINIYGPVLGYGGVDTTGFTLPAGSTFGGVNGQFPLCDSILVVNTGGTATTVTWGLGK